MAKRGRGRMGVSVQGHGDGRLRRQRRGNHVGGDCRRRRKVQKGGLQSVQRDHDIFAIPEDLEGLGGALEDFEGPS